MRFILFTAILLSIFFNGYASTITKNTYANIYADALIDQFDKELEFAYTFNRNLLESETYAKIVAAREYIEHGEGAGATEYKTHSFLNIRNAKDYRDVVAQINQMAKKVQHHRKFLKMYDGSLNIIYPSISGAGNLTGNTYPKNTWSLTFDDGPHTSRTHEIVDALYRHQMKASFFVLMRQVNQHPEVLQYVLDAQMELALHSYNHLNLHKETQENWEYEIATAKKELEQLADKDVESFRLPYGAGMRNKKLRSVIAGEKLVHIFWNVDTLDWKDKNPESIYQRTIKQMALTPKNSGIILFHDIHPQTVIASEMVMEYLKNENKAVCTVGEMIKWHNGLAQNCL